MSQVTQTLIFRLSSLGDVIISLAYLENLPEIQKVDWVISKEYEFLLKNHPKIGRLYVFDKKNGIIGWLKLLNSTLDTPYTVRVDLHVTLRTFLARLYFLFNDLKHARWVKWKSISKQRIRTFSYLIFKDLCPKFIRPTRYWMRFARVALSKGQINPPRFNFALKPIELETYKLKEKEFLAIMPASRWSSKEWDTTKYISLLKWVTEETRFKIVLLGRSSDIACADLAEELFQNNIPFVSLLDEPDFSIIASMLSKSYAFIGSDTGLAHLSEAVGTRSWVIYGPTRPDLGFGPRMKESFPIHANVFCSPCSKDGKICYRFWQPYECLNRITPSQIMQLIREAN